MEGGHAPAPGGSGVHVEQGSDGSLLYRSTEVLAAHEPSVLHWLERWACDTPDQPFLAQRGDGGWRRWTYAQAWAESRALATRWLAAGRHSDRSLLLLAGNSVSHARLMLAGMWAGMPTASVNPRYASSEAGLEKLRGILTVLSPQAAWLEPASATPPCLALLRQLGIARIEPFVPDRVVKSAALASRVASPFALPVASTLAKLVFTSGSTGNPKAVPYTHGMMTSNIQMVAQRWPFLGEAPPVMLDWLPWSHVFGGNNNLNLTLRFGGALYIDAGAPSGPGLQTTLDNLRSVAPTFYCNVPSGFAALLPELERDAALRQQFFSRLQALFFAGAALPEPTWHALQALSIAERGQALPILSGWGSTESGPNATLTPMHNLGSGNVGTLAPGVTLRLLPVGDKLQAWIRSPSVAAGYSGNDAATRAAFDAEGFFNSGDALRLADPTDADAGFLYDGRTAEDFKLQSGTWVNAAAVRMRLIAAGEGAVRDAVLFGPNRPFLTALVWLREAANLPAILDRYNASADGSSQRIEVAMPLVEAPDLDAGEINEKGYVNQARSRELHPREAELMYSHATSPRAMVATATA